MSIRSSRKLPKLSISCPVLNQALIKFNFFPCPNKVLNTSQTDFPCSFSSRKSPEHPRSRAQMWALEVHRQSIHYRWAQPAVPPQLDKKKKKSPRTPALKRKLLIQSLQEIIWRAKRLPHQNQGLLQVILEGLQHPPSEGPQRQRHQNKY